MPTIEAGPLLYTIYKINSKWLRDINVRTKSVNYQEKTWGEILNIGLGNNLLTITPKHRQQKDKLDFIKIKTFVHQKII